GRKFKKCCGTAEPPPPAAGARPEPGRAALRRLPEARRRRDDLPERRLPREGRTVAPPAEQDLREAVPAWQGRRRARLAAHQLAAVRPAPALLGKDRRRALPR